MKKFITILLLCLTFVLSMCFVACGNNTAPTIPTPQPGPSEPSGPSNPSEPSGPSDPYVPEFLDATISGGKIFITGGETDCVSYNVYAAGELVVSGATSTTIDLVQAIKDSQDYPINDWAIDIEGLDATGAIVKGGIDSYDFAIKGLNSNTFTSTLNSATHTKSDYFILEDDIYIYSVYDSMPSTFSITAPTGWTMSEIVYCPAEYGGGSIANLINRPLESIVDGNGHSFNFWIDYRVAYQGNYCLGTGGIYNKVTSTGGLINTQYNIDYIYVQMGGFCTGPLIYQGFEGVIDNCYVNANMRPVNYYTQRHEWYNRDGDCPVLYEEDKTLALIGLANNATIKNSVFSIQVYDQNGNMPTVTSIGVIGDMGYRMLDDYTYDPAAAVKLENVALIANTATPCFTNHNCVHYPSNMHRRFHATATNVMFFTSLDNFINGNGYIKNGEYNTGNKTFNTFNGNALAYFDCLESIDDEILFMGNLLNNIMHNADHKEGIYNNIRW